ncbi:MAG: hypothetical protein KI785_04110, partial [Devosiaceae bacterium]|nr:hypothetical protein [Devosiaceae bacterium MH13]
IAFITGWLTLGINRAIVWELSFFGTEFVLVRLLVSLPMPILCGLAARLLPGRTDAERDADRDREPPQVCE